MKLREPAGLVQKKLYALTTEERIGKALCSSLLSCDSTHTGNPESKKIPPDSERTLSLSPGRTLQRGTQKKNPSVCMCSLTDAFIHQPGTQVPGQVARKGGF